MSAWAQLLSVGVVWISLHCAGMCGPIIMGLDVAGVGRGLVPLRGAVRIVFYQLGRMTTLGIIGALAGLVGRGLDGGRTSGVEGAFRPAGAVFALTFGCVIAALAIHRLVPRRATPARPKLSLGTSPGSPRRRSPFDLVKRLSLSNGLRSAWLIGVCMGFLPCMIVVWALGLAAMSASPIEGALVMIVLVAMTTPMLLGVSLLPRLVPRRLAATLPAALMALSGAWMVLVGLASLDVVPHVHLPAGDFTIMLW